MPVSLIETARDVAAHGTIQVYAPDDPTDLRRMVNQGLRTKIGNLSPLRKAV